MNFNGLTILMALLVFCTIVNADCDSRSSPQVYSGMASEAVKYRWIRVPELGSIKVKDSMSEKKVVTLSKELLGRFKQGKLAYQNGDYQTAQEEFSILADYGHTGSYKWLLQMHLLGQGKPME